MKETIDISEEKFKRIARFLRLAIIKQQWKKGNLSEEEALDLLNAPLSPDDKTTFVDDRHLLKLNLDELKTTGLIK